MILVRMSGGFCALSSAGLSAVLFTFESTITICVDEFFVCVLFKCLSKARKCLQQLKQKGKR